MSNPFKQLKRIVRKHHIDSEELVHALMATVYTNCCDGCSDKFHSENFMKAFNRMIAEMKVTRDLSTRSVAVGTHQPVTHP